MPAEVACWVRHIAYLDTLRVITFNYSFVIRNLLYGTVVLEEQVRKDPEGVGRQLKADSGVVFL
jgi:hypothetical protein